MKPKISTYVLKWLESRLKGQEYDLVYVDPLICDPQYWKPWAYRRMSRSAEQRASSLLLGDLVDTLGINPNRDGQAEYMEPTGAGSRLARDRDLQRKAARKINARLETGPLKPFPSIASVQSAKRTLEQIADKPRGTSLIVVDSMLTTFANLPGDMRWVVHVPSNFTRSLAGVLTDMPGTLAAPGDPMIGLRMDAQASTSWSDGFLNLTSAGWYPFVRTIGLYCTNPAGHPFIDVIAVLALPIPSLDQFLVESPGRPRDGSLPQLIQEIGEGSLKDRLSGLLSDADNGTAMSNTASSAPSPSIGFEEFREYFFPPELFQILCYLNKLTASALRTRAGEVYEVLASYLQDIKTLKAFLDPSCKGIDFPTDVDTLLPDPKHLRNSVKMLPAW